MNDLADRLDRAADILAASGRRLPALADAATAFGADDAGLPGRLGRELRAHWSAVLDARIRETTAAAARLTHLAEAARVTRRRYDETDKAARDRFREI
jgi:hypothetical protein